MFRQLCENLDKLSQLTGGRDTSSWQGLLYIPRTRIVSVKHLARAPSLLFPTYRANAARLRLANGSLFPFFSRGMTNHLFVHSVYGHQDGDHWSIFHYLQEAVVALDDGCAWLVL